MQTLSPSLLLWKRMSSETLEEGEKWTQEEVRQKSKIKCTHVYTQKIMNKVIHTFMYKVKYYAAFEI